MDTQLECRCCQRINVQAKLKDPDIKDANFCCIRDHPGFDSVCLNIWAIQVAFLAYRQQYGGNAVNGENNE